MGKKSNHKHEYELIEIKEGWFTHAKVCKICGHVYDEVQLDDLPIMPPKQTRTIKISKINRLK